MSQTANDETSDEDPGWSAARNQLFKMIMYGRSFSGRERNCCFLNIGQGNFATISALSGLDHLDDGRCIAITDWDGDGDQDLWMSNRNAPRLRFMRNDQATQNHFVSIGLVGNGTSTNRDSIGARVEVVLKQAPDLSEALSASESPNSAVKEVPSKTTSSMTQSDSDLLNESSRLVKALQAGEGFLSQSSKWLHFGLGRETGIERVVVDWPGGERESFSNIQIDRRNQLIQGRGVANLSPDKRRSVTLAPVEQQMPTETQSARIAFSIRLKMPRIRFTSADGSSAVENFQSGESTLVNLWASWCAPCVKELSELSKSADDLKRANVRVLALSVDSLGDDPTSHAVVSKRLADIGYRHRWGYLDAAQMDRLQELHHLLFFLRRPLPLPTSFLIDESGRLAIIYRGPVSTEQLIQDVERTRSVPTNDYRRSFELAACLPGRAIQHPRVEAVARGVDTHLRYLLAAALDESGRFVEATEHFKQLAQHDPDWAVPQRHLAKLFMRQGDLANAARSAARALELDPNDARAHNSMGLIFSQQRSATRAEFHLRESIRLDEKFAEAHNNLGSVLAPQRGKLMEAGQCFLRAVQLDDHFAEAHTNLGSFYAGSGKLELAAEHFQKAIHANPEYADAHRNLGSVYANQGLLRRAIDCYQEALRIDPSDRGARENLERAKAVLSNGNARR